MPFFLRVLRFPLSRTPPPLPCVPADDPRAGYRAPLDDLSTTTPSNPLKKPLQPPRTIKPLSSQVSWSLLNTAGCTHAMRTEEYGRTNSTIPVGQPTSGAWQSEPRWHEDQNDTPLNKPLQPPRTIKPLSSQVSWSLRNAAGCTAQFAWSTGRWCRSSSTGTPSGARTSSRSCIFAYLGAL